MSSPQIRLNWTIFANHSFLFYNKILTLRFVRIFPETKAFIVKIMRIIVSFILHFYVPIGNFRKCPPKVFA